jgi:hypothetical protein
MPGTAAPVAALLIYLPVGLFRSKSEFFLGHIAESHDNNSCQDLCRCGIDMELLHKELDEDIIQPEADNHQQKIAEELYPSVQGGFREYDVAGQKKPRWKAHAKRNENRCNMGLDDKEPKVHVVFVQDKIIPYGIHDDVEDSISTPAGRIAKSLQGHYLAEGRVKEIDKRVNAFFQFLYHSS